MANNDILAYCEAHREAVEQMARRGELAPWELRLIKEAGFELEKKGAMS